MTQTDSVSEHQQNTLRGLTFFWTLGIIAGFVIVFGLTQWGLVDDVVNSETDWIAIGASNAIGLIAVGGWNAIGLVAFGGANSIGLVAIGGINSIGVVSIGGANSVGLVALGGLNGWAMVYGARMFVWSPSVVIGGGWLNR